jgi:alpha-L-fucosidase
VVWEACQTLNGSWGYDRDNLNWKSSDQLIRLLVDTVSKDDNLLLNVGPNGRGELEPRALETLNAIGAWMRLHSRSIHGAGPNVAPKGIRAGSRTLEIPVRKPDVSVPVVELFLEPDAVAGPR